MRGDPRVPGPIVGGHQSVSYGASQRTASGVGDQTRLVLISTTTAAHYAFGGSGVVATTSDTYIPAEGEHLVRIAPGQYVAFIQESAAGVGHVSEMDS